MLNWLVFWHRPSCTASFFNRAVGLSSLWRLVGCFFNAPSSMSEGCGLYELIPAKGCVWVFFPKTVASDRSWCSCRLKQRWGQRGPAKSTCDACCATTGGGTPPAPAHVMENRGLQSRTGHRLRHKGLKTLSPSRTARSEQYVCWSTEPSCPTLLRTAAQEFSLVSSPCFHALAPAHLFQLKTYSFIPSRVRRGLPPTWHSS